MKTCILLTLFIAAMISLPIESNSQTLRTGRSVAMAGAGVMSMYGAQAEGWNPANLGFEANPAFTFIVPSFGMALGNNAFSPDYIGNTIVKGKYLDSTKKSEILSKMGTDRLKLYTAIGLPVFGFSFGNVAFNLDAHLLGNAAIPADLFELALTGPVKDKIYDLGTVEESALGYSTASFSTAMGFENIPYTKEFTVGATFKYIIGGTYTELVERRGTLQVNDSAIEADGMYKFLNSKNIGDGVGIDLGVAGRLNYMDMYVGLTLGNLVGTINWGEVEVKENHFVHHGGADLDRVGDKDYWNQFLLQSDTTYTIDGVNTPLPKYLLLAADKSYLDGKGDLFCSYYQGLNQTPGQNTVPKLALGSEFRFIPILPLRAGIAVGGIEGLEIGGGFGLHLLGYQMNLGASWHRGVAAGAQGFSLAITNYFGPSFRRDED